MATFVLILWLAGASAPVQDAHRYTQSACEAIASDITLVELSDGSVHEVLGARCVAEQDA